MTLVYALLIAMALIVVFLAVLVVGMLRGHAEVLRRLDALGVRLDDPSDPHDHSFSARSAPRSSGLPVGEIVGVHPSGDPVVVSVAAGDDPVLLAFLSTTCSSCTMFWEGFDSSFRVFGTRRYRVVVITLSENEESPTRASKLARGNADVVMSSATWSGYEVPGAPYFVVLDGEPRAVVGEGSAGSMEALATFIDDSSGDRNWDASRRDRTDRDRAEMIDEELRRAGLEPGDPRLYPSPGDLDG